MINVLNPINFFRKCPPVNSSHSSSTDRRTESTFLYSLHPNLCSIRQCGLHEVRWSHIGILMYLLAAEPRSTAGLFHSQYLCGPILLTLCSMMWDWRVLRSDARPMLFIAFYLFHIAFCILFIYYYYCFYPLCLLLFSHSLHSFYGLVLWGWGLRTDRVSTDLSGLAPPFLIFINIIIIIQIYYYYY